jgi:hypothetical protein
MIRGIVLCRGIRTLPQDEPNLPPNCRKRGKDGEALITYQKG